MSLINDTQQKNSGVPKPPSTVKIPKPAVAPPAAPPTVKTPNLISAFEEGNPADLQIAPGATALPESVAAPEPSAQPQQPGLNLTQYLDNSTPIPLPAFDAPVVPQGTSLWKDTQINLGVPNLYDPKIVTTQEPTLYRNPLSTGSAAVDQANANLRGTVQRTNASLDEQARNAQASQAALQNATRSALPNTPDATKPWYGQVTDGLSRWAFGSPAAEAAAKRGEVNVARGSYGVNGAGAGGLFNTVSNFAIGLPLAVQSTINRTTVEGIHQAAKLSNPPLRELQPRLNPFTRKTEYVKLRYNDLSEKEQREYVARGYNQSIAWTGFNQPITDLTGETNYAGDLLRLQRTARVAEPNPELSSKRTTGAFYDVGKTKEGFFERPQTAIPEIIYNLLTPGNKIDIAGEVVGRAIGFVAKPLLKKVAPIFRRAAGTKPVQVEIVTPSPGRAAPSSAIEVSRAVRTTNTPEAPYTPPTASSGAPVTPNYNQGIILKLDPSQQLPASKPIIPAYKGASVRPSSAEEQLGKIITPPGQSYTYEVDPSLAVSAPISRPTIPVAVTREGKPVLALPPAVENIPDYKPTLTQVFPKTDAVGLAAEVGVGTPGRIIEFTPETSTRSLEDVIAHLSKTPEGRQILQDYTGKTWEEFREHIAKNHSDIDVGQFGSIGTKVEEINPTPPKLSDLTEQATELAEQRALVEQPIQQLEKLFDEAVDLGRRTDDRLPLTKLTAEDFYRAIDNGAKPPLLDEALNVFEREIAEALRTNDTDALGRVRFEYQQQQIAKALELHNAALEPRPLLTAEAKFPRYVSPDAPRTVFHGTALARFTPDYNVETFGSRGELGSGLYTTTNKVEAESYAKAVVGENRSAEIAYEPIKPQVVELDTSAFKAPLNARAALASGSDEAKAVINSFSSVEDKRAVARSIVVSGKKTYADYVALAERRLAETNASEQALQTYNKRLSKRLRGLGYDAIHDPQSGWFAAIDNGKLKQVNAEPVAEPASAVESAIARYNADSVAAAAYPDHLTSDANLRDSAYKVLDQTRADIDEKLAEVQQQAQAEIANTVQEPVVKVAEPPASAVDEAVVSLARAEVDAVQSQAVEVFDEGDIEVLSDLRQTDTQYDFPTSLSFKKSQTVLFNNDNLKLKVSPSYFNGIERSFDVTWELGGRTQRNKNQSVSTDSLKTLTKVWKSFVKTEASREIFTAVPEGTTASEIGAKVRLYKSYGFKLSEDGTLFADNRLNQLAINVPEKISKADAEEIGSIILNAKASDIVEDSMFAEDIVNTGAKYDPEIPTVLPSKYIDFLGVETLPSASSSFSSAVDFSNLDSKGLKAKAAELGVSDEGINFRSKPQRVALQKQLEEAAEVIDISSMRAEAKAKAKLEMSNSAELTRRIERKDKIVDYLRIDKKDNSLDFNKQLLDDAIESGDAVEIARAKFSYEAAVVFYANKSNVQEQLVKARQFLLDNPEKALYESGHVRTDLIVNRLTIKDETDIAIEKAKTLIDYIDDGDFDAEDIQSAATAFEAAEIRHQGLLEIRELEAKAAEYGVSDEGINFRSKPQQEPDITTPTATKTPRELAAEFLANKSKEQPSEDLTVPESDVLKELKEIQKEFLPGTEGYINYSKAIEEQILEDAKAYKILAEQNSGSYFPNIDKGSEEKREAIKELKRLGSKKAKDYYATYMYTEDIYDVNRALRLSSTSPKLQKFVDRLYKELNTIPDFQGTVHRGTFPGEHTFSLKVGDVFTDKGFLSTNNAAHEDLYDLPVQFYFESYSGKAINQHIGFDTGSDEVLFFPNTKFKITSIEETAEGKIIRGYETNEPLGKAPEPPNPHETTTDLLNAANEEPPSLCNL